MYHPIENAIEELQNTPGVSFVKKKEGDYEFTVLLKSDPGSLQARIAHSLIEMGILSHGRVGAHPVDFVLKNNELHCVFRIRDILDKNRFNEKISAGREILKNRIDEILRLKTNLEVLDASED